MLPPVAGFEQKSTINTHAVPVASQDAVLREILAGTGGYTDTAVSAVHACVRVISEGLALPPCYVHQVDRSGRKLATDHALFDLLNKSPNSRQTSYEFREMIGWNLALHGNAYVFVKRGPRGSIVELLPVDAPNASMEVDDSRLFGNLRYYFYGEPIPLENVWHIKGPSSVSSRGQSLSQAARNAIELAANNERFGSNLFKNGAKPSGLVTPKSGTWTAEQVSQIKTMWDAQNNGVDNAHKTMLLTSELQYTPMSTTANDAQWVESRRFQIEEICRYFRVSPTKIFSQVGSQSYASVEQAHIAHDQDTDAQWIERFVQSANKSLLTLADRRAGIEISIDNRAALRGTATERMTYYQNGIAAGIFTRNEAREMEGFDRSNDPSADLLTPAANLFGNDQATTAKPSE